MDASREARVIEDLEDIVKAMEAEGYRFVLEADSKPSIMFPEGPRPANACAFDRLANFNRLANFDVPKGTDMAELLARVLAARG